MEDLELVLAVVSLVVSVVIALIAIVLTRWWNKKNEKQRRQTFIGTYINNEYNIKLLEYIHFNTEKDKSLEKFQYWWDKCFSNIRFKAQKSWDLLNKIKRKCRTCQKEKSHTQFKNWSAVSRKNNPIGEEVLINSGQCEECYEKIRKKNKWR